MKLVHETTGVEIKIGDKVTTFRGVKMTLLGFTAPHRPGSTGRVLIARHGGAQPQEFFPSVINANIVEG